jgi:DNA-binding IclR family transcriptional regulator
VLSRILKEFEKAAVPMDLNELARSLDIERSALEGMLGLLVRQGKLREIRPGSESCAHCASRLSCAHLQSGELMGTVYELPD